MALYPSSLLQFHSIQWTGDNFEELLERLPNRIRVLSDSVSEEKFQIEFLTFQGDAPRWEYIPVGNWIAWQ